MRFVVSLRTARIATQESKSILKRIGPLDDRLREMTRFGERQLSLERSQLLEIVAFGSDDRFGPEARVDATTASSAYGRTESTGSCSL